MEPKKKIKKFEGLKMKEEPTYRPGRGLLPDVVMTPSGVERPRNRYIMELPTEDGVVECFVNCEKPSMDMRMTEIPYLSTPTYVPNFGQTQPIRVVIRDVIGNHGNRVNSFLMEWFQAYSSGQYARTYKRSVTIKMLDPTGVLVESWFLQGCFPSAVMFHDYSPESFDPEIEFTLNYDRFTINT